MVKISSCSNHHPETVIWYLVKKTYVTDATVYPQTNLPTQNTLRLKLYGFSDGPSIKIIRYADDLLWLLKLLK